MRSSPFEVLLEDNHLLALCKPAMLPTMGVAADRPSLLSEAKKYIKQKYNKPGNVYLGIVSRLDAPVTGVVLLAHTSKAAARLNEQFRSRTVEKLYWALVKGRLPSSVGECQNWLRKDERHRRMHLASADDEGAQEARLSYRVLNATRGTSLLLVKLDTGRKHQIRVQLAALGHPVLGDRKYGSAAPFPRGIALHARCLRLTHPVRQEPLEITAPVPVSWSAFDL